jgi:hypothetical protein
MDNCLAFEMSEVEGWGSGGLMLSFFLKEESVDAWKAFIFCSFKIYNCVIPIRVHEN